MRELLKILYRIADALEAIQENTTPAETPEPPADNTPSGGDA